jgi:Aminoacyl tRNA synthetase class II, N-terminal domain/tRNA synthetases class II core domain (F)
LDGLFCLTFCFWSNAFLQPASLNPQQPMNDLDQLVQDAQTDFSQAALPADLENAKARYLGKAGRLTEQLKALGALPADEKKARGALINSAKQQVEAALNARRQHLADAELEAQLQAEALDVTLPGRQYGSGGLHPVSRVMERIEAIFASMGFDVADGPEIETDWIEQPGEPSGAFHARHLLRGHERRAGPLVEFASPHLADAGAICPCPCKKI